MFLCVCSSLSRSGLCGIVPTSHQPDDGALPACPLKSQPSPPSAPPSPPPPPSAPPSPPPPPIFTCAEGNDPVTCSALSDFYFATNGFGWYNASRRGWISAAALIATDYCTFAGVFCSGPGVLTSLCVADLRCLAFGTLTLTRRVKNVYQPKPGGHHPVEPWEPDCIGITVRFWAGLSTPHLL